MACPNSISLNLKYQQYFVIFLFFKWMRIHADKYPQSWPPPPPKKKAELFSPVLKMLLDRQEVKLPGGGGVWFEIFFLSNHSLNKNDIKGQTFQIALFALHTQALFSIPQFFLKRTWRFHFSYRYSLSALKKREFQPRWPSSHLYNIFSPAVSRWVFKIISTRESRAGTVAAGRSPYALFWNVALNSDIQVQTGKNDDDDEGVNLFNHKMLGNSCPQHKLFYN